MNQKVIKVVLARREKITSKSINIKSSNQKPRKNMNIFSNLIKIFIFQKGGKRELKLMNKNFLYFVHNILCPSGLSSPIPYVICWQGI